MPLPHRSLSYETRGQSTMYLPDKVDRVIDLRGVALLAKQSNRAKYLPGVVNLIISMFQWQLISLQLLLNSLVWLYLYIAGGDESTHRRIQAVDENIDQEGKTHASDL